MNKIYANDIIPGDNFHPGEFIKDEIDAREMKQQELADKMGIAKTILSEIIHGKRNLTPLLALKLEEVLGINAEFWMRLQVNYEISSIRKEYGNLIGISKLSRSRKSRMNNAVYTVANHSRKMSPAKVSKKSSNEG